MNIRRSDAGIVSNEYILSKGFTVYETIKGNDMGQMEYELPQYTNGEITIEGGYWTYFIKDKAGNCLWEGWWNSNDEFDNTLNNLKINE